MDYENKEATDSQGGRGSSLITELLGSWTSPDASLDTTLLERTGNLAPVSYTASTDTTGFPCYHR